MQHIFDTVLPIFGTIPHIFGTMPHVLASMLHIFSTMPHNFGTIPHFVGTLRDIFCMKLNKVQKVQKSTEKNRKHSFWPLLAIFDCFYLFLYVFIDWIFKNRFLSIFEKSLCFLYCFDRIWPYWPFFDNIDHCWPNWPFLTVFYVFVYRFLPFFIPFFYHIDVDRFWLLLTVCDCFFFTVLNQVWLFLTVLTVVDRCWRFFVHFWLFLTFL